MYQGVQVEIGIIIVLDIYYGLDFLYIFIKVSEGYMDKYLNNFNNIRKKNGESVLNFDSCIGFFLKSFGIIWLVLGQFWGIIFFRSQEGFLWIQSSFGWNG